MDTSFVCEVKGLSPLYVSAIDEDDARDKLKAKLAELNVPHGDILSVKEVPYEGVKGDD